MIPGAVLLFGLLFGLQHALEADHLTAVATLVAGSAALVSVAFGLNVMASQWFA